MDLHELIERTEDEHGCSGRLTIYAKAPVVRRSL
jgi:hydroxyacyl-ACP dehydratase HTD2-like protein with hotdog domain